MPFRKHPTYVRKARNGYQLQRGVPRDVQPVIGKTIWVEGAGSTYRVAQRLSPVFAAKTDRLIAEARNEVSVLITKIQGATNIMGLSRMSLAMMFQVLRNLLSKLFDFWLRNRLIRV